MSVTAAADPAAADRTPPRLEVRGLAATRGGRRVIEELSFHVAPGEIFGLLGPNGAGKTTAFHVLTGLLPATSGAILLDGNPSGPADRSYRARIGVVFQAPALDPRLTARENLRFAARLYGVAEAAARRRIDEILAHADLAGRADEPVQRYSGGMRRRIEIGRALLHDPEILILDEPTTGLDESAFRKTWTLLLELRRARGLTLLLTTHRPEEAEHCDRLAILDGGRLVACDSPDRLRGRVSGDLLVLETDDAPAVAASITARLGIPAHVAERNVVLERPKGHEWVPRIVEAFPEGTLRSVSVRRPGLGEAFLELTGRSLDSERRAESEPARAEGNRS